MTSSLSAFYARSFAQHPWITLGVTNGGLSLVADSLAQGLSSGAPASGVAPGYDAIASGRYPGARPLFLYVKTAHLAAVPRLAAFLDGYLAAAVPGGRLVRHGLIAAPATEHAAAIRTLARRTPLDGRALG